MADMPEEVTVGVMPPAQAAGFTPPVHRVAVTRLAEVAGRLTLHQVRSHTPALRRTKIIAGTEMEMEITTAGERGRPDRR
jgi:hypothetical protein